MEIFKKSNEPIIIQNNNFKKCILFISFPIEEDDEAKIKILRNLSFNKSAVYNTEKKMYEAKVNNYCLSYYERVVLIGNTPFLELAIYFPSFDSLGKDVLEDNIKLIKEIIYNPYIENNAFSSKEVNDIKEVMKNNINKNHNDAIWYYNYQNIKTFDEKNFLVGEIIDNPNILDTVTGSNLYELYKKTISKSPIVFLIGNVDAKSSKEKLKEILLNNNEEIIEFEKKYNNYCKEIPTVIKEVTEEQKFKSSGVFYNYKIKDLKNEKEIALLKIVKLLLSSNNSRLLFNSLRKESDLVYRCGASSNLVFGSLTIWAITGKENINNVKQNIENVMIQIKNKDFIKEKLELIKEEYKLDDDLIKENIYSILMQEVDKYIECRKQNFYDIIKDIKAEEVEEFIDNRLVLVSKYIGVGEENE